MSHLAFVLFVHAVLSQFGDVMMACLNLLNVPIRKIFNESISSSYNLNDEQLELLYSISASTMMIGVLVGFLIISRLMEVLGTKDTAITIRCSLGIIGSASMVLSFITRRFEFFVMGHFLSGVVSALKVALFIYVADCSPDKRRGS
ncbi:unnamed protein product [Cylicostephanus goldi]|uniref:Major facilitator superfamily (MFS) profile domain-containing protein n=1 Tax=Cylicostephanus goldi TaxID=71465 RepID=A0A3P6QK72_CYLGO|nr:unnamed protein product [Cylicostephanus goldi]